MTEGILLYAFNNEVTDYEAIAEWSAKRIKKYLGLPTTIITDRNAIAEFGGSRIMHPTQNRELATWFNAGRYHAWEHSPYDQTIILDADYIVSSDLLLRLFDSPLEFACHQSVLDVTGRNNFHSHNFFGRHKFPQTWATVCYFKKNNFTRDVFDLVKMIKENYSHYSRLYNFNRKPFRNDYAFSIALSVLQGHRISNKHKIPWSLPTASTDVEISIDKDTITLEYSKHTTPKRLKLKGQDLHLLNKISLEKAVESA